MIDVSIKIKNYRSFGDEPQGVEHLPNVTVLVGRNNAGKSSLLDAIEFAVDRTKHADSDSPMATLVLSRRADSADLMRPLGGQGNLVQRYSGARFSWSVGLKHPRSGPKFLSCKLADGLPGNPGEGGQNISQMLNESLLRGAVFRRIGAERDVRPESRRVEFPPVLSSNGDGATFLIRSFATDSRFERRALEQKFLAALNHVFEPDCHFEKILPLEIGEGKDSWEVHLREDHKGGDIALSRSGSGLKTVILVLCHLILMPRVTGGALLKDSVFAFEELENNLHPAVLRRLLNYIREVALKEHAHFVLTTHSPVVIDAFASDKNAQVLHVRHNGKHSVVERVQTYFGARSAIDDLGVRASDLLQANAIVWVEGPSDAIYVNRWISLASKGEVREGTHYQCMFYGGKLLAHLDAEAPKEERKEGVNVLRINARPAVLIDRDRDDEATEVNNTKKRIAEEITRAGGPAWITKGREIENYLPASAIGRVLELETAPTQVGQFERFPGYLERVKPGTKFNKPKFAAQIAPLLDDSALDVLDLRDKVNDLVARIREWNRT